MKYIIEIKPEYEDSYKGLMILGAKDSNLFVDTLAVDDIEELNSDYINEHYSNLQDEAYQRGHKEGYAKGFGEGTLTVGGDYQKGLEDAWEAARKIVTMPDRDFINSDILDLDPGESIFTKYAASKAIAKLKAYEEQKAVDEIKVGDEVIDKDGDKTIVTNIHGELFDGLFYDGSTMSDMFLEDVEKTGRHFDIDKILEEMKE